MGKRDDSFADSEPTRLVKPRKARPGKPARGDEAQPGDDAADERFFSEEQLRARDALERMAPTEVYRPGQGAADAPGEGASGAKTVVYRRARKGGGQSAGADSDGGAQAMEAMEAEAPVVAWLVVVEGAGRGRALEISYGLNKIGRDPDQDIALGFGDLEISRAQHATIEYDPKDRAFYLCKGENLVYLNGQRVGLGGERKLETGDSIAIGKTVLRFVAFCGPDFDWSG